MVEIKYLVIIHAQGLVLFPNRSGRKDPDLTGSGSATQHCMYFFHMDPSTIKEHSLHGELARTIGTNILLFNIPSFSHCQKNLIRSFVAFSQHAGHENFKILRNSEFCLYFLTKITKNSSQFF